MNTQAKMKDIETAADVVLPERHIYEGSGETIDRVIRPTQRFNVFDHAEYPEDGGILVHYQGMLYPKKGFPTPDSSAAVNLFKKIMLAFFQIGGKKDMLLPILSIAILPWSLKRRILDRTIRSVNEIGNWTMGGFYLKRDRYCKAARSIWTVIEVFLELLGIDPDEATKTAKMIATIFEYDDAYRYRIQDIATEASRHALIERPIREILRLSDIYVARERADHVLPNFRAFKAILVMLLLHPKIKRAFRLAIINLPQAKFSNLKLDNADRYHVLLLGGYDYRGLSFEQRRNIFTDVHTFSTCCHANVIERKIDPASDAADNWETICRKCGQLCTWNHEYPPEMEVEGWEEK